MTKKKKSEEQPEVEIVEAEIIETPEGDEEVIIDNEEVLETPEEAALEEIRMLQKELSETQSKANEYLDGWQRSRAEFANYKKRIERDQSETYQRAAGSILKRQLDVADDLALALKNRPASGDGAGWADGIELIYRKLLNLLESEGVKQMEVQGQPFDPNLHEAISMEPSDTAPSGHVCEVLKPGYLLGDKVLRPALVRVAQ
jgi:molecular chaperone GrpE